MLPVPPTTSFVPRQAQQRPHRKSRLGCKVCKARKIKCDEIRPGKFSLFKHINSEERALSDLQLYYTFVQHSDHSVEENTNSRILTTVCGNCTKRFPNAEEQCEFEVIASPSSRSPSSAPSPSTRSDSIARTLSPSQASSRSMELRLFHHYATVTCHTMPLCEEAVGRQMWAVAVPAIAFECEYVYSAILAISALHLLTMNPDDVALRAATYQYIDQTLSSHREELTNISSDNSLALFTSAVLLALHAKIRSRCQGTDSVPYTLPLNYMYLQLGAKDLYYETKDYIEGSIVKEFIELEPEPENIFSPSSSHDDFKFPSDILLSTWSSHPSIPMSAEREPIYAATLAYLSHLKDTIKSQEKPHWVQRRICKMPSKIPREFMGFLEQQDPLAVAILARFFALLKYVDEPWYIRGTAEYEVTGMASLMNDEWAWAMEWPLAILDTGFRGGEIDSDAEMT